MAGTSEAASQGPIVVVGAGVIGLTTAVRLLQRSPASSVHILASHFPGDELTASYASTAAGAHHLSFADDGDLRQVDWDKETFQMFEKEWAEFGEASGLMRITQTEYYDHGQTHLKIFESHPNFKINPPESIPSFAGYSVTFTSYTIHPPTYLARLLSQFLSLGGQIHRYTLPSLSSLHSPACLALLGAAPSHAILCIGLAARDLPGLEDSDVFPTRGQVVIVKAPWVREGWTWQVGDLAGGEGGERTYVIPRWNGEVVLGGTREVDDWYPYPREETTQSILRRALLICPALCPPHLRSKTGDLKPDAPSPLQELILKVVVGFRPSRAGGIRLDQGKDVVSQTASEPSCTKIFFNYGHSGAGWQCSWGTAESVVNLALNEE